MHQLIRTSLDEASTREILDRVLDGCVIFDALTRFLLPLTDFTGNGVHVALAPERRRRPFIISRSLFETG